MQNIADLGVRIERPQLVIPQRSRRVIYISGIRPGLHPPMNKTQSKHNSTFLILRGEKRLADNAQRFKLVGCPRRLLEHATNPKKKREVVRGDPCTLVKVKEEKLDIF